VPPDEASHAPAHSLDHFLGLDLAVRYDWADRNVAKNARPPHPRKREPDPPTPDQAARLLNLVWAEDEEFGLYLWTAFTTGARRGEVSALRENRFDFVRQQVRLARNYLVKQGQHIEKAPKDGEGRVLSLDLLTCELFQERFQFTRYSAACDQATTELADLIEARIG
jgi:integrase